MRQSRSKGLIRLLIMLTAFLTIVWLIGCQTLPQASVNSVCSVDFDYVDKGASDQNKRAMLAFYCICFDDTLCK